MLTGVLTVAAGIIVALLAIFGFAVCCALLYAIWELP
jgi:hypothetical protein